MLAGVALLVVLIKPWGAAPTASQAPSTHAPSGTAATAATPDDTVSSPLPGASTGGWAPDGDPVDRSWQCAYASAWRVFVLGSGAMPPWLTDPGVAPGPSAGPTMTDGPAAATFEATRAWLAVDPLANADGPLDPRVPVVEVIVRAPPAIGYCAPTGEDVERPAGDLAVAAWALVGGEAEPMALRSIGVTGTPYASTEGLYAPASDDRLWSPGRYVFRLQGAEGYERWFGVEVLSPAG